MIDFVKKSPLTRAAKATARPRTALGVLVVARAGRRDCPDLDAILAG